VKVFKSCRTGFSPPKRNLETVPEKGLFSQALIAREPLQDGLQVKKCLFKKFILGMKNTLYFSHSATNKQCKVTNFKINQKYEL
jgi:hypothetical protein